MSLILDTGVAWDLVFNGMSRVEDALDFIDANRRVFNQLSNVFCSRFELIDNIIRISIGKHTIILEEITMTNTVGHRKDMNIQSVFPH